MNHISEVQGNAIVINLLFKNAFESLRKLGKYHTSPGANGGIAPQTVLPEKVGQKISEIAQKITKISIFGDFRNWQSTISGNADIRTDFLFQFHGKNQNKENQIEFFFF